MRELARVLKLGYLRGTHGAAIDELTDDGDTMPVS
jgi:hypothetical protein